MITARTRCLAAWIVLGLAGATGCNGKSAPANPPVPVNPPDGSGSGTPMASKPSATAKVTGQQPGRPPLTRLTVEVALDNPGAAPRWFVIASEVRNDFDGAGGIDRAEVRGSGAALVGTFFGTGGFHATRLAGKSKATIKNLTIAWWSDNPGDAIPRLTVWAADDLTLGGKPASDWFGAAPLVPDGTVIDAGGEAGHEHRTPDGAEAAVARAGEAPMAIDLSK